MSRPLSLLAAQILPFFIAAGGAMAQSSQASATPAIGGNKIPLWRCTLPAGIFEVAVRSIVSVSTQEYLVDGAARVTELDVDTTGNALVRFYYLEPAIPASPVALGQTLIDKAQEVARDAASRAGQDDAWKKVVKNYPTSTHAHTIEYRLDTKDELDQVFKSVEQAFRMNQDTQFQLP